MTVPVMRPWLGPEEAEAAAAVIASGSVAQGPRVAEFEAASYADRPRPLLPVTERVTASSVILPLFHDLTAAEQDLVVSVIGAAAGRQPAARA